jgi:hypothetical protein
MAFFPVFGISSPLNVPGYRVIPYLTLIWMIPDCLCGLVVGVLGYRSRGPGSIPGAARFF